MTLLVKNGERGASIHQYEICRSILSSEFGIAPSSETTRLFHKIRRGDPPTKPKKS
jgi:DNA-binding SARP family transcriptional activator